MSDVGTASYMVGQQQNTHVFVCWVVNVVVCIRCCKLFKGPGGSNVYDCASQIALVIIGRVQYSDNIIDSRYLDPELRW